MALTKITSDVIESGAVESTHIASGAISSSHLTGITTDNVSEGSTNTYFTNARARGSVSVTGGNLSYDSSTGVIQLTTDQIRTAISAGTGVSISAGEISIGQSVATDATPTFGNITTTGYIAGPATFTIDPAAVGDNTGTVVIAGNLQVDGTTTTINSTTLTVDDKLITLASGSVNAAAANGAGIEVDITGVGNPSLLYDGTNDEWDFNSRVTISNSASKLFEIERSGTGNIYDLTISDAGTGSAQLFFNAQTNDTGFLFRPKNSSGTITNALLIAPDGQLLINKTGSDVGASTNIVEADGNFRLQGGNRSIKFNNGSHEVVGLAQIASQKMQYASGRMTIDYGNSRVGIGTATSGVSPTHPLHVHMNVSNDTIDETKGLVKFQSSGGNGMIFGTIASSPYTSYIQSGYVVDTSLAQYNIALNPIGGNVGIGTTNPAGNLHVVGATGSSGRIYVSDADDGTGGGDSLLINKSGASGYIYNRDNGSLNLGTNDDSDMVVINSSGYVGINTNNPQSNLHVFNDISIDNSTSGTGRRFRFISENAGGFTFRDQTAAASRLSVDADGRFTFLNSEGIVLSAKTSNVYALDGSLSYYSTTNGVYLNGAGANGWLRLNASGVSNNRTSIDLYGSSAGDRIKFRAGDDDAMEIIDGGHVGIGDASPPSKLTVLGTNGAVVASNGAGVNGIQVTRTTNSTENIYFYCTDGNAQGWGGIGNVGRIESYGNNILEIGTQQSAPVSFGSNDTEVFRLRSDGTGLEFPDNNTFISTASSAGGSSYEWGSIRRPASSDGGQLSIRQYSTGDTAANYPAYAGGRGGWDENTGMYFPDTDQVGLSAGGNSGLVCYPSTSAIGVAIQDCLSTRANTTSIRAREHFYHFLSQSTFAYAHMKTDIPWASTTQMYSIKFRGHEYGAAEPIDVSLVWYNYNPSNAAVNIGSAGTHTATVYSSSDGYTVMRITFSSGYYTAFTVSQYPTAQGCALFNITAAAANSTATHY